MRAAAYHRWELATCCIWGPGASSMISVGFEGASVAKKKSGPWPSHAVPLRKSLASMLVLMASSRAGLLELASAISRSAVSLSASAKTRPGSEIVRSASRSPIRVRGRTWPVGFLVLGRNMEDSSLQCLVDRQRARLIISPRQVVTSKLPEQRIVFCLGAEDEVGKTFLGCVCLVFDAGVAVRELCM